MNPNPSFPIKTTFQTLAKHCGTVYTLWINNMAEALRQSHSSNFGREIFTFRRMGGMIFLAADLALRNSACLAALVQSVLI